MEIGSGVFDIYHRGAFGVARFDKLGNAKALEREAGNRDRLHVFFVYVPYILLDNPSPWQPSDLFIFLTPMEKEVMYVSPQVEVLEVEVEKGFAASYKDGTEQYVPDSEDEF